MSFQGFNQFKFDFAFENVQVRTVDSKRDVFKSAFPRHMHPFYELHYIIGGKGTLVLDNEKYELSAGDLFFTAPKVYHAQLTDVSDNMEEYHFAFELIQGKNANTSEIVKFFQKTNFYICKDKCGIGALFAEIEKETTLQQAGFSSVVRALLQTILLKTARNYFQERTAAENKNISEERRQLILDEAFLYSYKDVTLQSLSELLYLDVRQIQRIIYKKYGMSFVQLRTHARLSAAQNMICNGEGTLLEIAGKCGYENYAYFTKIFKEKFGVLPSEYKKTHKE